jgi:hypothetical protein
VALRQFFRRTESRGKAVVVAERRKIRLRGEVRGAVVDVAALGANWGALADQASLCLPSTRRSSSKVEPSPRQRAAAGGTVAMVKKVKAVAWQEQGWRATEGQEVVALAEVVAVADQAVIPHPSRMSEPSRNRSKPSWCRANSAKEAAAESRAKGSEIQAPLAIQATKAPTAKPRRAWRYEPIHFHDRAR